MFQNLVAALPYQTHATPFEWSESEITLSFTIDQMSHLQIFIDTLILFQP